MSRWTKLINPFSYSICIKHFNYMNKTYLLTASKKYSQVARKLGITDWSQLINHVQQLPYGRNTNRNDFNLVLTEAKGSCSSKHALLQSIADENNIPNIQLLLGIYKMNSSNTPKIGQVLSSYDLDYIPEAHCYLKIENKRYDFTSTNANFEKIEHDILKEIDIIPSQVVTFKVEYHKQFLQQWILTTQSAFDFDQIWAIRELCIKQLSLS